MPTKYSLTLIIASLIGFAVLFGPRYLNRPEPTFDGQQALEDVEFQVDLGPRIPGEEGHTAFREWLGTELYAAGWQVEEQVITLPNGRKAHNVIASRRGRQSIPRNWVILGAHYDTRIHADEDPDPAKRTYPVPGANDGASGVAVLLELARALPEKSPVWLVFFDAEDNGRIPEWDWIMGSRAFVASLEQHPEAVVIVDMVGDADLSLPIERNSDPALAAEIWSTAASLGYSNVFRPLPGYSLIDDHTPFLEAGIPAVDIIDFDYPYWHTTEDTPDKVSAQSLQIVGDTLLAWLLDR